MINTYLYNIQTYKQHTKMDKSTNSQIINAITYLQLNESSGFGLEKDIQFIADELERLVSNIDNELIITRETLPKIKLSQRAINSICRGIKSNKNSLKKIRISGQ